MTGAEAAGQLVAHTGRRPCIPAAESAVNERECDGEDSPNRDSEHDSADTQPERALHRSAHRLRRSTIRDRMQRRFERDCSRHLRFTKRRAKTTESKPATSPANMPNTRIEFMVNAALRRELLGSADRSVYRGPPEIGVSVRWDRTRKRVWLAVRVRSKAKSHNSQWRDRRGSD